MPSPSAEALDRLLAIMARLRDPKNGCPWDLAQTFRTIVPHTIEEAYEVADAIERDDLKALPGELGDLLFQVVFYAQMASEAGHFGMADILAAINAKMIERHPHVFGTASIETAEAQTVAWEVQKAKERAAEAAAAGRAVSVLDGVAAGLPALTRAEKLQKRAARIGFDWPAAAPVIEKIEEEIAELRAEMTEAPAPARLDEEMGDLLFACANLARHLGVDPEGALRRANAKFERRFKRMEALAAAEAGSGSIGSGSIGSGSIGSGSIGSGSIGSGSIGSGPIGSGSIGSGPIGSGPIGSGGGQVAMPTSLERLEALWQRVKAEEGQTPPQ